MGHSYGGFSALSGRSVSHMYKSVIAMIKPGIDEFR